jgi:hypothetical protein
MAGSTLSFYPHFLAYTNEWGPGRDQGWRLFSSSNLDWGQGLLELRTWMERWNQEYVYLASFGSGAPAGYGIRDVPLPHAAALPDAWPAPAVPPRYAVISSHYIVPNALGDDPFREFREVEFVASLGHVLFVYDLTGRSSSSALRVR